MATPAAPRASGPPPRAASASPFAMRSRRSAETARAFVPFLSRSIAGADPALSDQILTRRGAARPARGSESGVPPLPA
ncbi:hypothetical protein [Burkholderia multivorans]|jgi:hypothetical protein|uniref:hypothetical protein n=1 Tax=Burkholderia multivorans TaxID=87883 RepID=UPI000754AB17|nr:hypothetical protein [Burkholderia multivorans]KVT41160.1 hypothetical protein WK52_23685 [Burkholderia multivorans]MBU9223402.1 hypothetical protein [Burkholderia multivorans]MBU9419556.1 hypothetical protein [Burkholderia multivorans]MBU9479119.1 hypothetical protein [Burkholderia multivorans]